MLSFWEKKCEKAMLIPKLLISSSPVSALSLPDGTDAEHCVEGSAVRALSHHCAR